MTVKDNILWPNLDLQIVSTRDATIAILSGMIDGERYRWTGTSKRHGDDEYVPEIGIKLATARAFRSAAAQLERQGNGLVKHLDDVSKHVPTPMPEHFRVRPNKATATIKATPVRTAVARVATALTGSSGQQDSTN